MRLIRFGGKGKEKPGIEGRNGEHFDASDVGEDFDGKFFESSGIERLELWADGKSLRKVAPGSRLGPPICTPSKIVCVGLNYKAHAEETSTPLPAEPVLFMKATSSYSGPYDGIIIPRNSEKTDYEVELAVVIGRRTSYVEENDAENYIAGYGLFNDVSERDFQARRAGQWVKGKSADSFGPFGPYFVTRDEIKDVHNLGMWLKVNGEVRQNSNTSDMIFRVPFLVSYVSRFMTLLPGDIISTGTPSGVAAGRGDDAFLKPGDIVEYGIEGLGTSRHEIRAFPA